MTYPVALQGERTGVSVFHCLPLWGRVSMSHDLPCCPIVGKGPVSPCLMTYPVVLVGERANVFVSHDLSCCPSGRKGQCLRNS
jgi:hypothetical protein